MSVTTDNSFVHCIVQTISLPWNPSQPTSKKIHIWVTLEDVWNSLWGLLQFMCLRNSKIIMVSIFSCLESSWQLVHATDLTHNKLPVTFILVLKIAVCIEQGISIDPTTWNISYKPNRKITLVEPPFNVPRFEMFADVIFNAPNQYSQ